MRARLAGPDLRLLVPALAGWAASAWCVGHPHWQARLIAGAACLAGVFVALAFWRRGPRWSSLTALSGLAVVLAVGALAAQREMRDAGPVGDLAREKATVTLSGRLASEPRVVRSGQGRDLVVVRLDVETVRGRGQAASVTTPVLILGDERWAGLHWRELVEVTARLTPPQEGAEVMAVARPATAPRRLDGSGPLIGASDLVRERFREVTSSLPSDAAGLLPGLVLGDTSREVADLTAAMRDTGLTHLTAVSGSNVSIVLLIALGAARLAGLPRRLRPVLAALTLAAFVILVRPDPSVVRAAVMGSVGLVGLVAQRRALGLPALATAIIVLLVADPWLAVSYGFALSVLATLGLLLWARPWGEAIGRLLPRRLRALGPVLAIPLAAQVMCAPVIVLLQGGVSVISVPANVLAAPFVAPATVVGVVCAVAGLAIQPLALALAWIAGLPALAIAWIARMLSEVPYASLPWPDGAAGALLLAVISVALLACGPWLVLHSRRAPLVAGSCVAVTAVLLAPVRDVAWPLPSWRLVVCDVGQGDGLVVASSPGRGVVIDTGPDPEAVAACLDRLGIQVVDAVVLSHFHADHADGLPGVLRGRSVRQVLTSPVYQPQDRHVAVLQVTGPAGIPVADLYAGDEIVLGEDVSALVRWPKRVISEGSVPNNASLVLDLVAGDVRVLLLGDIERQAAREVLLDLRRRPPSTAFDVVKVAHHGSANQDPALIAQANAAVATVSVGAGNTYGHPAPSTLTLLQRSGAVVLRTDESGDIAIGRDSSGRLVTAQRGN